MKVLFVQTGDFAEAYDRMQRGEPESYRDQNASVAFVAGLAPEHEVTTVALGCNVYDRTLAPGLHAVGRPRSLLKGRDLATLFDSLAPEALVLRSPFREVLAAAKARHLPTLPCFADLFEQHGPRDRLRFWRLRRLLTGAHVPCVANHGLNATRTLVTVVGLPATRVLPWDWSRLTPNTETKSHPQNVQAPKLFYAGVLSADKGVGDCLAALKRLHDTGITAQMTFAGSGDQTPWRAEADRLGLTEAVHFAGLIPNTDVRAAMAAHDIVIVPSRHSYPEGLPNTIYEGLASRSALVLSDHPAFAGRIEPDQGCVHFQASDATDLAAQITRLCHDPALYQHLSAAAASTLNSLYFGIEWSSLMRLFIDDPLNRTGWVARHAFAAL